MWLIRLKLCYVTKFLMDNYSILACPAWGDRQIDDHITLNPHPSLGFSQPRTTKGKELLYRWLVFISANPSKMFHNALQLGREKKRHFLLDKSLSISVCFLPFDAYWTRPRSTCVQWVTYIISSLTPSAQSPIACKRALFVSLVKMQFETFWLSHFRPSVLCNLNLITYYTTP